MMKFLKHWLLWTTSRTLPGDNEAGHAVRNAGASCQERDAHDDIRDPERVADYGHLHRGEDMCL